MKSKRIISLAAAALLSISLLSGCSQNGGKTITAPTDEVSGKLVDSLPETTGLRRPTLR